MEIPKIVEELLADKAANNNTIDLDAYANGLLDMYQALQLHKTQVSGSFCECSDDIPVYIVCQECGKKVNIDD